MLHEKIHHAGVYGNSDNWNVNDLRAKRKGHMPLPDYIVTGRCAMVEAEPASGLRRCSNSAREMAEIGMDSAKNEPHSERMMLGKWYVLEKAEKSRMWRSLELVADVAVSGALVDGEAM